MLQGLPYSTYLTNPNSLHINILNAISSDLSEPEASNVYVQSATPIGTTGVRLTIVADGYNDPPDTGAALCRTLPPPRIVVADSILRWLMLFDAASSPATSSNHPHALSGQYLST